MLEIIPETPSLHGAAIEALYDRTFGPGHFAKTAERLREANLSVPALSRVAVRDGTVIGVCRVWPVEVGVARAPNLFIGPVAVDPNFQGQRLGLSVTGEALEAGTLAGWTSAVIIGSPAYFGELGFTPLEAMQLSFPGPQDPARVMVRSLVEGAAQPSGLVQVPLDPKVYL